MSTIYTWPNFTGGGGGSGTVTSITAGFGLSGGTITTTGTISLNAPNVDGFLNNTGGTLSFISSIGTIYPANHIPFGDGSTPGGITSANLIWSETNKDFLAGDLLAASHNTVIQIADQFSRAFIGSDANSRGLFYYGPSASKLGGEQGFVVDFPASSIYASDFSAFKALDANTRNLIAPDGSTVTLDWSVLNQLTIPYLGGGGLQMVTADNTGKLAVQAIPGGGGDPPVQFLAYGSNVTLTGPADVQVGNSGSGHSLVNLPTTGGTVGDLYIVADFGANASAMGITISAQTGLIILDSQANSWQIFTDGFGIRLRLVDNTPGAYVFKIEAVFNTPINPSQITGTPTQIPYFDATTGVLTDDANFTRNNSNNFETIIRSTNGTNTSSITLNPSTQFLQFTDGSTFNADVNLGSLSSSLEYIDITGGITSNITFSSAGANTVVTDSVGSAQIQGSYTNSGVVSSYLFNGANAENQITDNSNFNVVSLLTPSVAEIAFQNLNTIITTSIQVSDQSVILGATNGGNVTQIDINDLAATISSDALNGIDNRVTDSASYDARLQITPTLNNLSFTVIPTGTVDSFIQNGANTTIEHNDLSTNRDNTLSMDGSQASNAYTNLTTGSQASWQFSDDGGTGNIQLNLYSSDAGATFSSSLLTNTIGINASFTNILSGNITSILLEDQYVRLGDNGGGTGTNLEIDAANNVFNFNNGQTGTLSPILAPNIPIYATRTLALAGGLIVGNIYQLPIAADNQVLCVV